MAAANNAHELALLNVRRGVVGKITGSTNDAMNTGTFILMICFALLFFSMIGIAVTVIMSGKSDVFVSIADNLFKAILAIITLT